MGPEEGLAWKPATSGNQLTWDGSAVVKTFGSIDAWQAERAALAALRHLRVPRVLDDTQPGVLRLEFIDGGTGTEAIEAGFASEVLFTLGSFLKALHETPLPSGLKGEGRCLIHGDFAHYNCLFDPGDLSLLAVIDWETAHPGDPLVDLAWCEHQFRSRFPREAFALPRLFAGYGSTPDPAQRENAVQERLQNLSS